MKTVGIGLWQALARLGMSGRLTRPDMDVITDE